MTFSLFEQKVYKAVKRVKKGRVATYADIARAIGKPRSFRAVANALDKNYSGDIPCHRVVCSDGLVGGYNRGPKEKIRLLRKEGIKINGRGMIDEIKNQRFRSR